MKPAILKTVATMASGLLMALSVNAAEKSDTTDVIYEVGNLEIVSTMAHPEVKEAVERARPLEPGSIPTPKFTIRTHNNKFMMTIGGKINPTLGYDIGNNLYSTDAGSSFVVGDIPVPALAGHKGDFFINALNGNIDFTVIGFGGTRDQVTGYIKLGTNGNSKGVLLKRAYVAWRNVSAGLMTTLACDPLGSQPSTIDPQGPNGEVNTASYQIRYVSPSYDGFRFAASIERPTYYSSNGIYRGNDYRSWYGHQVNADVDQLIPDIPLWIEYQKSEQNRIRFTAILRTFAYQNMLDAKRENLFAWGTMLSGNFSFYKPLTFYFQGVYGRGIANYIQDLQGRSLSFTPKDDAPGKMVANPMMGLVFGASYQATPRLQFNAVGSYARIWDVEPYAMSDDTTGQDANGATVNIAGDSNYRYGVYCAVNCYYQFTSYLQLGIEYDYGRRVTYGMGGANDSRIQTQLSLTF
ncbi:MAG: hypothetical protein K2L97_06945 [Muribaculaceae bacterium]|nr:hypothetical protein [Muribaculaceae bacterium]